MHRDHESLQKLFHDLRLFAVPIFGTSKPVFHSVLFCVIFFGTSKKGFRTPRWVLNGTDLQSECESFWVGHGVEFEAKHVFEREQIDF